MQFGINLQIHNTSVAQHPKTLQKHVLYKAETENQDEELSVLNIKIFKDKYNRKIILSSIS